MAERITELSEPPVVGQFYLVPTVLWPWMGNAHRVWPVFLPRHDDAEHLNFPYQHYHIDPRFVQMRLLERDRLERDVQRTPISKWARAGAGYKEVPAPVWRLRKCHHSLVVYQHGRKEPIEALGEHFAGTQAQRNRYGWVCPHRNAALGSILPRDGVITCPLHGLRIRASDGVCLGAHEDIHDSLPAKTGGR